MTLVVLVKEGNIKSVDVNGEDGLVEFVGLDKPGAIGIDWISQNIYIIRKTQLDDTDKLTVSKNIASLKLPYHVVTISIIKIGKILFISFLKNIFHT